MTETEWLSNKYPWAMLHQVRPHLSELRWRELGMAVLSRIKQTIPEGPLQKLFEWMERNIDRPISDEEWNAEIESATKTYSFALTLKDHVRLRLESIGINIKNRSNTAAMAASIAEARHCIHLVTDLVDALLVVYSTILFTLQQRPQFHLLSWPLARLLHHHQLLEGSIENAKRWAEYHQANPDISDLPDGLSHVASDQSVKRQEYENTSFHYEPISRLELTMIEVMGQVLHDMVGNPYQPLPNLEGCRTQDVIGLATTIDSEKCYDKMPVLADALLEAGCDDPTMLEHCQGTDSHYRGCWVIDLILDRDVDFFANVQVTQPKKTRSG